MIVNLFKKIFRKKRKVKRSITHRSPIIKNEIAELFKDIQNDIILIRKLINNDNTGLNKNDKKILKNVNENKEINVTFLKKLDTYLRDYLCAIFRFLNKMAANNESLHNSIKTYSKKINKNNISKFSTNSILNKCKKIKLSDEKMFKLSEHTFNNVKDSLIRKLLKYKFMSDKLLKHNSYLYQISYNSNYIKSKNLKNNEYYYLKDFIKDIKPKLNKLQDSLVKYVHDKKSCNQRLLLKMFHNKSKVPNVGGTCYANALFFAMFYNMPDSFTNKFQFHSKKNKNSSNSNTKIYKKDLIIPTITHPVKEFYNKYISDKKKLKKLYDFYVNKYNEIANKLFKKNVQKKYETYKFLIDQLEAYSSIIGNLQSVYDIKDLKGYIQLLNNRKEDGKKIMYNSIEPNINHQHKFNKLIQQIKDITQNGTSDRLTIPLYDQPMYTNYYNVDTSHGYNEECLYLILCHFYDIPTQIYYTKPYNKLINSSYYFKKPKNQFEKEIDFIDKIKQQNIYLYKYINYIINIGNLYNFKYVLYLNNLKYVKKVIGNVLVIVSNDPKQIKKYIKKIKYGFKIGDKKFKLRSASRGFYIPKSGRGHADSISMCNGRWIYYDANNTNMRIFNKTIGEFLLERNNDTYVMFFVKE